ncbi:MAG: SpoIIE family protein phosphatase [Actinobacteria bacterium]|nr:SpoIIE family protein phosphatase [Actinomycetota bacterium]
MNAITTLPAQDRSPGTARRVVQDALMGGGLEVLLDDALLLVTELVTNSVVHAGTDVELHVDIGVGRARVEVVDRGAGALPNVAGVPGADREGGRGIFLLDALAQEWGTRHFAGGKSVWFTLGVSDRVVSRPRSLRASTPGKAPSPPVVSWLLGLPADLEERLSPAHLLGELLHRLCGAMDLADGWLYAEGIDDTNRWAVLAAHDLGAEPPEVDAVRRLAREGVDQVLSGGGGLLVLPLRRRTGVFGALVVGDADRLDATGVALARLVGDRMGVVLRDDRAHVAQLRDRGSLALLAEASEMFAGTLDVTLAVTLAAQLVVPRFATWAGVYTAEEQGVHLAAVAHQDEEGLVHLRAGLEGPGAQLLAEQLVRELGEQPSLLAASDVPRELAGDVGEVLAVPLVARRRLLGVLLVGRRTGTGYARDDSGLLLDLARRAALAVDNARLYEERAAVAKALQASLLPPALPTVPGVEFGARYAAAGEGNEVGGDFYDVFALPHVAGADVGEADVAGVDDGQWAVAIGDVCGKGAEAAAITGLARNVLRLLGREGRPPQAILQRLNSAILELGERGRFCTASLAAIHPSAEGVRVRLSCAGHPLPVLVTADGRATLVGTGGSLLGVMDEVHPPADELFLRPGDTLVFYTDGVTERRSGDRMFGEDSLLASCAAAAGRSADEFAGQLEQAVRDFGDEPSRDDLAVLVVRATG